MDELVAHVRGWGTVGVCAYTYESCTRFYLPIVKVKYAIVEVSVYVGAVRAMEAASLEYACSPLWIVILGTPDFLSVQERMIWAIQVYVCHKPKTTLLERSLSKLLSLLL